jgi:hypothetical protein
MLTLVDAVCVAGSRERQNDDAVGWNGQTAWVIDGATDLHDAPLTGYASDAAWFAHRLNAELYACMPCGRDLMDGLSRALTATAMAWESARSAPPAHRWLIPTAALAMVGLSDGSLTGLDLGDCRAFVGHSDGTARALGGGSWTKDEEGAAASAHAPTNGGARYRSTEALAYLRQAREAHNLTDSYAILSTEPERCLPRVRCFEVPLAVGEHVLLATDGFAALSDVYRRHDAAGLVRAAREQGLAALLTELRGIETADPDGKTHARWKRSDDATAILLRRDA